MKTIATHQAKTQLSRYLQRVSEGESFIIARGRTPMAKLVPVSDVEAQSVPENAELHTVVAESAAVEYSRSDRSTGEKQARSYERAMERYLMKPAQPLKGKAAKYPKRETLYER